MIVRCWGARGSVPVSGKEYVRYGGDTTCIEIRSKNNDIIIIDAGTGIRRLGNSLLKEDLHSYSIFFTHVHWDHILGFPFFKPNFRGKTQIDLYGRSFDQDSIKSILSKTMTHPYFPVIYDYVVKANINYHEVDEKPIQIGSIKIETIPLCHPNMGVGYKFIEDGKTFVFLTDNELTYKHPGGLDFKDYMEFSKGADLLIHDAEYTEEEYQYTKTFGHSIYTDALRLALEAGVKNFGMYHLNQDRTDDDVDKMVKDCKKIIKEQGSGLKCFAAHQGMELKL